MFARAETSKTEPVNVEAEDIVGVGLANASTYLIERLLTLWDTVKRNFIGSIPRRRNDHDSPREPEHI